MPSNGASAPTPKHFNVYLPGNNGGQYLAFDTLAAAQADVQARNKGVVLNRAGNLDPTQQVWSGWARYQSRFTPAGSAANGASSSQSLPAPAQATGSNTASVVRATAAAPRGRKTPAPHKPNVFIPAGFSGPGVAAGAYVNGGYLAFESMKEARAYVQKNDVGVLIDSAGHYVTKQPWAQAASYQYAIDNGRLTPTQGAGKAAVWFPYQVVASLQLNDASAVSNGAYLSFSSEKEAAAYAQQRGFGVVLDASGTPAANQPWYSAQTYAPQALNSRLQTTLAPNKYHLWFPPAYLSYLGLRDMSPYASTGAYLPFDTEAEATAHLSARGGIAVVLDSSGNFTASQPSGSLCATYIAQLLGSALKSRRVSNAFNAWLPPNTTPGINNSPSNYPHGAYLGFGTEAEANAFAQATQCAVVLDKKGKPAANQPWFSASQYIAQRQNERLAATRTPNKPAVFYPSSYLTGIGVNNATGYPNGAYLAFDTDAEAQAHAAVTQYGVVLDKKGALATQQPGAQGTVASAAVAQLFASDFTTKHSARKFGVWFATTALNGLGLASGQYPQGAFLATDSEAAAAQLATFTQCAVVLDHKGRPTAQQPWSYASTVIPQLLNGQLSATRMPKKFSAFFPQVYLYQIGVTDPTPYPNGAYLSFDTEAQAQAHVVARSNIGVVVNPDGSLAATQPSQASGMVAQAVGSLYAQTLTTQPPPNAFSVWVPSTHLNLIGVANIAAYPNGAYLAFNTEAEATAHATITQCGVVLDQQADPTATQPWPLASQVIAQRLNPQLTATRSKKHFSVLFPPAFFPSIGVTDPTPYPNGAYLAFDTEAEAQAHVIARNGVGAVLDKKGELTATQPGAAMGTVAACLGQLFASAFAAQATPKKWSVWVPANYVYTVGLSAYQTYPNGAYLTFDSETEAQALAASAQMGVVLDPKGDPSATQPWPAAGTFVAQALNAQLTAKRTPHKWSVWLPQNYLPTAGVSVSQFTNGAYLAFDTEAQAITHVQQRTFGVVLDQKGHLAPTQPMQGALSVALTNPEIPPPPPSGWVSAARATPKATAAQLGAPTAGSIAIGSVKPTAKGADVVVHVGSQQAGDIVQFSVGGQLAGNWTPIYAIPDRVKLPNTGWTTYTLHIDYSKIDDYLKTIDPNLAVSADMESAIGLEFVVNGGVGHNTGLPSWASGQGTEKAALLNLPAKTARR